jgi:putative heme degradation protein
LPQITQFQTAKSNKCEVGMVEIWEDHNLFWSKLGDVHRALGWLSKKPTRRFQVLRLKTDKASIIVDCNKTLQVFIYIFLIETEGDLAVFKIVIIFKNIFYLKIYENNIFLFLKIILTLVY